MDNILKGLDFVFVYIDDVLIASKTEKEHLEHLRIVFSRFEEHGIVINPAKCEFGSSEIDFLGFHINEFGSTPTSSKVKAILDYKKPETIMDLRRFICMINFYHRFIPHAARYQAPLNAFMKGAKKKDKRPVLWTKEAEDAFIKCKETVANATLLAHPVEDAELALKVDASDFAIGAVIEQNVSGKWQPLAFFSKS